MAALLSMAGCSRERPLPGDIQATAAASSPAAPSEIEKRVFPPELIMERQSLLGLTAEQKTAIQKEVERAQAELQPLQWELGSKKEQLTKLLDADKTDEAQALAVAEKVMAAENKVKAAHLTMLVRIKNALTPEQQKQLRGVPR
ncbi:MAG TPA: periplasmic heavy metal sensor [Myxococcales bacterium]